MNRARLFTFIVGYAAYAVAGLAQTRPATGPALETPQAVQAAYRTALNAQDATAALALFHARTPGERATAEVLIANDLAAARLAAAAEKAFGVPLLGGGTLLPPAETEAWKMEGDLAAIPERNSSRTMVPPLRKESGSYKIDLLAWGMDWMDAPDGDEARARHAHEKESLEKTRKRVDEGFYRTLQEVNDHAYNSEGYLSPWPPNPAQPKPSRRLRRPVKVDLTSPLAAYRSAMLAQAEGDGAAWLRCHAIVDPSDQARFDGYARFITTNADLEEAALAQFGTRGAAVGVFSYVPHPRREALDGLVALDEVKDAPVVGGNEATWETAEGGVEFVRVGGEWKLRSRAKGEIGEKPDDEGTDWTKIFQLASDLQSRFAQEVAAGKYKTAEEAKQAIAAAMKSPSTGPT